MRYVMCWVILLVVLALLAMGCRREQPGNANKATPKWLTSYDQACKQAKASNKFVLADFTGSDWCSWCQKLDAEVFDTQEFVDWAAKNVVLLEVDFPQTTTLDQATKKQNDDLAAKYRVDGFPTILFLKSDGTVVGKLGYMEGGPKNWITQADKVVNTNGR